MKDKIKLLFMCERLRLKRHPFFKMDSITIPDVTTVDIITILLSLIAQCRKVEKNKAQISLYESVIGCDSV